MLQKGSEPSTKGPEGPGQQLILPARQTMPMLKIHIQAAMSMRTQDLKPTEQVSSVYHGNPALLLYSAVPLVVMPCLSLDELTHSSAPEVMKQDVPDLPEPHMVKHQRVVSDSCGCPADTSENL